MNNDAVKWEEIVPGVVTTRQNYNIVRFSISKNPSGSLSGSFYIAKNVALKAGLLEHRNVKVFANPSDHRQFLLKSDAGEESYRISGGEKSSSKFVKVNFRLIFALDEIKERDFKARTVKHTINEEEKSLMVDINWEKSE